MDPRFGGLDYHHQNGIAKISLFFLQVFWLTLNYTIVIFLLVCVIGAVFWVIVLRLILLTFMHR